MATINRKRKRDNEINEQDLNDNTSRKKVKINNNENKIENMLDMIKLLEKQKERKLKQVEKKWNTKINTVKKQLQFEIEKIGKTICENCGGINKEEDVKECDGCQNKLCEDCIAGCDLCVNEEDGFIVCEECVKDYLRANCYGDQICDSCFDESEPCGECNECRGPWGF
eukprot:32837_1